MFYCTYTMYVCDYACCTSLSELSVSEEARLYSVPGLSFAQIILMTPITLCIKVGEMHGAVALKRNQRLVTYPL